LDLPQPYQVWTIRDAKKELVGEDQKIVVYFGEHPKGLGCNKTNLRRNVDLYGADAREWQGKQLLVYRSSTSYQGQAKLCVRVCGPNQTPPDPICDSNGAPVLYQPVAAAQPAPQPPVASQPVAQPVSPWEGDKNSPPNAS
jgi:hypothetical protein